MNYIISSGEVSSGIILYLHDYMTILDGGTANSTTVNEYGDMYVSSGGTANSTTINQYGYMYVSSGGTANSTTVNSGGYLEVSSGGTATDIVWTPCVGHVYVNDGAVATFASEYSGVYYGSNNQLLSHSPTMDGMEIDGGGEMYVMSGGTANSTTVEYGSMYVSSGGTANSTTVNSYRYMCVSSGGTANSTTINQYGYMYVSSGGTANGTTVNSGGYLEVSSGGTATGITAVSGAHLRFAVAPDTWIAGTSAGSAFKIKDGLLSNYTVNSRDALYVYSGGTATGITAVSGARLMFTVAPDTWIAGTSAGSAFEIKDGLLSNYTVNADGILFVSSGGTANSTTVNFSGGLIVSSGGTANSTTVNSAGSLAVFSDGTANSTTINQYGYMHVTSGGTANSTTVNSGGDLEVSSGGTANSTTVNTNGSLYISSGGTVTEIVENGGYVCVEDGANAMFLANTINDLTLNGAATIHSGTTANCTTVNEYGYMYVYSGGTANNTTVNSGGSLCVSSGGTATGITAVSGARLQFAVAPDTWIAGTSAGSAFEMKDGLLSNYTVNSGGSLAVTSGGTANSTTVNSAGSLYINNGGTANSTTVNEYGYMYVSSGGTATEITAVSGARLQFAVAPDTWIAGTSAGSAFEMKDGLLSNYTVNSRDALYVYSGGTASSTTINQYGYMYVTNGGTANSTTVNEYGYMYVSSGGTATGITAVSGARLQFAVAPDTWIAGTSAGSAFEMKDGLLSNYTVNSGGSLAVTSGGTANSTTVNEYGYMYVSSGGTANSTTVNGDGRIFVYSGGTANSTTVNEYGSLFVSSGGTANSTIVNEYGYMYVSSGGMANSTTVNKNGSMFAYFGGTANSTTVNSSGYLTISSGGTATEVTLRDGILLVESGGVVSDIAGSNFSIYSEEGYIYSDDCQPTVWRPNPGIHVSAGGKLTGRMTFNDRTKAFISNGAVVDFDLTRTSAGTTALLNNFSAIVGAPYYTLTVEAEQASGTYRLADGVSIFYGVISVISTSGTQLGSIAVGQTATISGLKYTLAVKNSELSVTISKASGGGTTPVNSGEPDGGENDNPLLKDGSPNSSADIENNPLSAGGDTTITVDATGSVVDKDGYSNYVGGTDTVDYAQISLEKAAKLSFTVKADSKVKLTFYELTGKGDGTYKKKALKSVTVSSKNGGEKTTASVLVAGGADKLYYVAVENKNSKSTSAYYNVTLNTADGKNKSYFFVDGDDGKNNGPLLVKSGKVKVPNTEQIKNFLPVAIAASGRKDVVLDHEKPAATDANPNDDDWKNYVGFGDDNDYVKLNLTQPAKLNFTVQSTGNVKLVVYKVTQSNGKWSQKAVKTLTVSLKKAEKSTYATRSTGGILLSRLVDNVEDGAGYYVSVQSTNAKSGGQAWYNVSVDSTVFASDYGTNNKLFTDKKSKFFNEELESSSIAADGKGHRLQLETGDIAINQEGNGKTYTSFVGYGDEVDYAEVEFKDVGLCTFTFDTWGTAKGTAKFTIYKLTKKNNGSWTKKSMGSITVKNDGKTGYGSGTNSKTVNITDVSSDVKYYVLVQATNSTSKKGEMYYNITAALPPIPSEAALTMPETEFVADGLDTQDNLLAGLDLDSMQDAALASTFLDPASEKLLVDSGNGLLASL